MTKRSLPVLLGALKTSAVASAVATAVAMTACTPPPRRAPAAPPPPVAAVASPARPPEAPSLGGLLAGELRGRPGATPSVEQVASALQRAGVALPPMKQVLARTVGARYCAASTTTVGLAVAVCEFGSDADADRGLSFSRRTFDPLIPGRSLTRNRTTVLTLTPPSTSAQVRVQAAHVAAAFAAL